MSAPRHTTAPTADTKQDFDLGKAAAALTDAAAKAGAAIMAHYGSAEVEHKDDDSPVTKADHDSEKILLAALETLAPNIPIVSEESAGDRTAPLAARFFLVDPLDGTKEFIKKRNDFTVNVALIEEGYPRFGLVYAPARSLLAVTIADGVAIEAELPPSADGADLGALQQRRLHVRNADPSGLTALVSLSHLDPETEAFLTGLNIAERSSAGSSVKFLEIARGRADVYPRFGPTMEWDTAAGQAVLEASGGRVVDADGARFRYGKTQGGLRNGSFIAWGRPALTNR
ncbi:MAG: 3'(2'),5'-bisphosphate nucleotidase CysQ [Hyphomicrobiales bacterium]